MEEKRRLREEMKRRRDALSARERREGSGQIAGHLFAMPWYERTQAILVYAAIRTEVDLSPFCARAWEDGKRLYFPKVSGRDMEFYRVDGWDELLPGAFDVPEPDVPEDGEIFMTERIWRGVGAGRTPILVPGLAFSREGARLGYGMGYYDRYLARHSELFPVGICYEIQVSERLCAEAHDWQMELLVTEQGCCEAGNGRI